VSSQIGLVRGRGILPEIGKIREPDWGRSIAVQRHRPPMSPVCGWCGPLGFRFGGPRLNHRSRRSRCRKSALDPRLRIALRSQKLFPQHSWERGRYKRRVILRQEGSLPDSARVGQTSADTSFPAASATLADPAGLMWSKDGLNLFRRGQCLQRLQATRFRAANCLTAGSKTMSKSGEAPHHGVSLSREWAAASDHVVVAWAPSRAWPETLLGSPGRIRMQCKYREILYFSQESRVGQSYS